MHVQVTHPNDNAQTHGELWLSACCTRSDRVDAELLFHAVPPHLFWSAKLVSAQEPDARLRGITKLQLARPKAIQNSTALFILTDRPALAALGQL